MLPEAHSANTMPKTTASTAVSTLKQNQNSRTSSPPSPPSNLHHRYIVLTSRKEAAIVSAIDFGVLLLLGLLITSGCLYWWSREKKDAALKAKAKDGKTSGKSMEEGQIS